MSDTASNTNQVALSGLRVAFTGRLAGMSRRDAQQLVRAHGGIPVDNINADVDLFVVADESAATNVVETLAPAARQAFDEGRLVILHESQLWHRLGLIDQDANVQAMYTPAMLAELLAVPVAQIRHWHRRGLLVARRQVGRLPYFDFSQIATARHVAALLAAGVSQRLIEKQFALLERRLVEATEAAQPATVVVQGKHLLVRQGDELLEAGGQQRFDFDQSKATEPASPPTAEARTSVLSLGERLLATPLATDEEMVEMAQEMEETGQLELAAEMYRAAMVAQGPKPEICFALAELLYRLGDNAAARERYYVAIELDEDFVEARANLGCVLAEEGRLDLAVSAFEGALAYHDDFPDAHYHLAQVLDDLGRTEEATVHWRKFLQLAPDSPWAVVARERLNSD